MDPRYEQLQVWLKSLGIENYQVAPASADASFRRYFRVVWQDKSYIVMDAPPDKEDCHPFIMVAEMLHRIGLNVPVILEQDLEQGLLLLSDLGNTVYLSELNNATVDNLYTSAMDALLIMQRQGEVNNLPPYDKALLENEAALFHQWFIEQHLQQSLSTEQHKRLNNAVELLVDNALAQPQVCVHRDYHSRNLMINKLNPEQPGILDFQDAVVGPVTYDLVSLLKDCYIDWPREQVEKWVSQYREKAISQGVIENISHEVFLKWFDLMGMQRHLKAIGIFARLKHRDGKTGYIKDIPRTLDYVIDVAERYPEFSELAQWLIKEIQPAMNSRVA